MTVIGDFLPFVQTRSLHPKLAAIDREVALAQLIKRGETEDDAETIYSKGAPSTNCTMLLKNLRNYIKKADDSSAKMPNILIALIAETSRCDEKFGDRLRTVRSRFVENVGQETYLICAQGRLPEEDGLSQAAVAAVKYEAFVLEQVRANMTGPSYLAAVLEDNAAAFSAAVVATGAAAGLWKKAGGPRGACVMAKNAIERMLRHRQQGAGGPKKPE
jgi:hypothetical protein